MVVPGTVLAGKYQIERVLGQGGMGVVVAAMHLQLNQRVAIKFLLESALANHQAVERFLREARAAARLRSEHVGRVIDVGALETGAPYMVMELLEGEDLASLLARSGTLPVQVIADFMLQALVAVAEAHALGIVHRDIKPANLFLTRRLDGSPCVKVLDFGIAKATTELDLNLTGTAMIMGSPGYMSPEQLRSARDADARSDIWALGVVMYELASGQAPFTGATITELAVKAAIEPPPPLPSALPPSFAELVYRCLEKDPARRYQHVAALAAALAPFGSPNAAQVAAGIARVSGHPVAPGPVPGAVTIAAPGGGGYHAAALPTTLGGTASEVGSVKRPRSKLPIAAAAVALIGAAVVAIAWRSRGAGERVGEPAAAAEPALAAEPPVPPPRAAPSPAQPPPRAAPSPAQAPVDAGPPDAAPPDAAPPDAAPPIDAPVQAPIDAAPARKVRSDQRPRVRSRGSAAPPPEDVENSRF